MSNLDAIHAAKAKARAMLAAKAAEARTAAEKLALARALADEVGASGIFEHALKGRVCGCHQCFCCAAYKVLDGLKERQRTIRSYIRKAIKWRHNFERCGMPEEAGAMTRQIKGSEKEIRRLETGGDL